MVQCVDVPTRKQSILDPFITNRPNDVTQVSTEETLLSDHLFVDVLLSHNPSCAPKKLRKSIDGNSFRCLDFDSDLSDLKSALMCIDWDSIRDSCTFQEVPHIFTRTLLDTCRAHVPEKKLPSGRSRALNALRRKKNRLKARAAALDAIGLTSESNKVHDEIGAITYEMRELILAAITRRETYAISKIKSNPKYFYGYIKSFDKCKESLNMLYDRNGRITTDSKQMADTLQSQFSSVYSNPDPPNIKQPEFPDPVIDFPFSDYDISVTEKDIIEAIGELKCNSACGPDGIPAILLKACAYELAYPLQSLWKESQQIGIVPDYYKMANVTPIYKKGSKALASNYRSVNLTSHVVKVYERFIRKQIVGFLENNNLLSVKQHGFRSNRSCLTQILQHFDDIIEGFLNNEDTDSIYLDYAKAFDRVDHELLLEKLRKYGFNQRIINWILSFLSNRSQTVVVNGVKSAICKIISGVPQGTVLGPILFLLFINDLEAVVRHSKIGFFADDTRISKKIGSQEDCIKLQEDLNRVMKWSTENNMQLHRDKFELLVHRYKPNDTLHVLPFIAECTSCKISDVLHYIPLMTCMISALL